MLVYGDLDQTCCGRCPRVGPRCDAGDRAGPRRARGGVRAAAHRGGRGAPGVRRCARSSRARRRSRRRPRPRRPSAWPRRSSPGCGSGLLHGQMPAADKEAAMRVFRAGEIDVLVATTVIEVGVDVPNATVMIVEDADRFGLSQLHQLRGRVGRGGGEAWCYLFADPSTPDGEARMAAMAESTDGFLLAERDPRDPRLPAGARRAAGRSRRPQARHGCRVTSPTC